MTTFNWFPGHMNKALKAIEAKLPAIDLVIEIVDARAPYSSTNHTLHQLLKRKPILTLFSKVDLADPKITTQWLNWYQNQQLITGILNYQDRHFSQKLIQQINRLMNAKIQKWTTKGLKKPQINVLVIGIPNVGKSTFINHLLKKHKAITANRPGVTRGLQLIQLSPSINIIDTPGVLPARLDNWNVAINLAAINSIKSEIYPKWEVGQSLIETLYRRYPQQFQNHYKFISTAESPNGVTLFKSIAKAKKKVIDDQFDWETQIIAPFISDLANGLLKISFEVPNENLVTKL